MGGGSPHWATQTVIAFVAAGVAAGGVIARVESNRELASTERQMIRAEADHHAEEMKRELARMNKRLEIQEVRLGGLEISTRENTFEIRLQKRLWGDENKKQARKLGVSLEPDDGASLAAPTVGEETAITSSQDVEAENGS